MSLNSLQDNMSRRAASMAAMAKRASNPQDIQAIQKNLIEGVQNGSIQPYVGIPLIQDLTNKLAEAKAQMAQGMAGAGMQQGPQGVPIAQQVMQQAAQESQGVEALPSNLPQEYAGGGIIAFENGGPVERYQNTGFTGGTGERKRAEEALAKLRTYGLRQRQQDPQGYAAAEQESKQAQDILSNMERAITGGPVGVMGQPMGFAASPAVTPPATPAANGPIVPYGRSEAPPNFLSGAKAPSATPGGAPRIGGGSNFKPPALQTYTPTIATMPERTMGDLTDLGAITKNLSADKKKAISDAVTEAQNKYEGFDEPGNKAREEKFGKREAAQEKDSAMTRALNLMNLGFGIAGSKERTLAGALGNEGRQGIQGLIQGEAASRAAKDRLEDARDNFEQQKVAAKKGNYQAAQAAGRDAGRDVQEATQMALAAAQAGNAQGISLYNTLTQRDIGAAGVSNQGQQLQLSAVDQQNRSALGLAGLDIESKKLAQQAASANAQLKLGQEKLNLIKGQIAAGDKRAQAALANVERQAYAAFETSQQFRQAQEQAKKMAPTEAQRFMQQEWTKYSANAMPSLLAGQGGGANVPSFTELMKAME